MDKPQQEQSVAEILSRLPPEAARFFGISPAELADLARMAAGTPAGEARGGVTGATPSPTRVQPTGEPLPAKATPAFTAVDNWTMNELWARAVPAQYTRLLRAPVLPSHEGRTMPGRLP